MSKKVLFISVPFMSLYRDVIEELNRQGYEVTYLQDCHLPHNFYDIHKRRPNSFEIFLQGRIHKRYWKKQIRECQSDFVFDILLVIDGFSLVNSGFLEYLEQKNPMIKKVLYLFDRTYNNYLFDLIFKSFHQVYSFDLQDCKYYGLKLLPIYWVPTTSSVKKIDVFGFGTYMPNRYILFDYVNNLTKGTQLVTIIKLYLNEYPNTLRFKIRKLIKGGLCPDNVYKSSLITHQTIPPCEFRKMLSESKIVLDSHDIVQDGLTARFMWALGSGAKIVTTNSAVRHYPFYDEHQIAIFDVENPYVSKEFLTSEYVVDDNKRRVIDQYRIDNWIRTLLSTL